MVDQPRGDSDADFELARRAVDLGWLTREQVEAALIEAESTPNSRLLALLPLTPDQVRQLEAPAPALPPELVQAAADPSRRVAQYILSDHQRAGGMGKVVKAWDTRLSRWVALKFLKKLGEERQRGNFEEEARLAAGLAHPNIAAIYEIGEHDGAPFIAMQFIDGSTLGEIPHGMSMREAARIVRDAARGVAFAHERGIIHRDLKPSNVMLDSTGRVFVMDFGLATNTEARTRHVPNSKRTFSGTPEYASPEQARGEPVDVRSDVHSLGATLYEVLTGKPPFEGSDVQETIKKLEDTEAVTPRRLNQRVPHDLETIALKCLEKNRDRRYSGARELADDLERFLQGDAIMARRASTWYRVRMRFSKRKPVIAVALAGAVCVTGLVWALRQSHESWRKLQEESLRREARFIGDVGTFRAEVQLREATLREFGALWTRLVETKQSFHTQPVNLEREASRLSESLRVIQQEASDLVARNPALPQGYYLRARAHYYLDDPVSAERDLRKAIELEPAFAPGHALLGRVLLDLYMLMQMIHLGSHATWMGFMVANVVNRSPEEVLADAKNELEHGARLAKPGEYWGLTRTREDEISEVLLKATLQYYAGHDWRSAIETLRFETDRNPSEEFMFWLGRLSGDREEKILWYSRAIARRPLFAMAYVERFYARPEFEQRLSRSKSLVPFIQDLESAYVISRNPLVRSLVVLHHTEVGNWDKAVPHLEVWQESEFEFLRPDNARRCSTMMLLHKAQIWHLRGNLPGALRAVERALDLFSLEPPQSRPPAYPTALYTRAWIRDKLGDRQGADEDLDHVVRIDKSLASVRTQVQSDIFRTQFLASHKAFEAKRYEEAIQGFRGIALDSPETIRGRVCAYNVARAYALLRDKGNALTWLEKAVEMGWAAVEHLERDPDLECLRDQEGYERIVSGLKNGLFKPKESQAERLFWEAIRLHRMKEHRAAIEKLKSLFEAQSKTDYARYCAYHIACAHACLGEKEEALNWLEKAVSFGTTADSFEKDSDFDSLRGEVRYKQLLLKLKAK